MTAIQKITSIRQRAAAALLPWLAELSIRGWLPAKIGRWRIVDMLIDQM